MMRTVIAVFITCICVCITPDTTLSFTIQTPAFSQRIPKADYSRFKAVRDAKDWSNPYLIIRGDGIEVISSALSPGRKLIAVSGLREALIKLPTSAWPYGRIVALQVSGPSTLNDELIPKNKAEVEIILKSLPVEIDWWPSA